MHSIENTLLSIKEYAEIMGLHPWSLSQIGVDTAQSPSYFPMRRALERRAKCDHVTYEYMWQDEHLSRHDIATAISQAEFAFAQETGYWPAPKYITDEELRQRMKAFSNIRTYRDKFYKFKTEYGYLQNIGSESIEEIAVSDTWTRYDLDGDGVEEVFEYAFTGIPADLTESEVSIFFHEDDIAGKALDQWEIRPIVIYELDTVGLTLTIRAMAYQFVRPELYLDVEPDEVDVSDVLSFVPRVVLHRRTTDTNNQGTAIYSMECEPSAVTMCYGAEDAKLGIVTADQALHPARTECSGGVNRLTINYLAGYPRQANRLMDKAHAQIIAWLATALLPCLPCGCACYGNDSLLYQYHDIMSFNTDDASRVPIVSNAIIDNPLQAKYGAVLAWNRIKKLRLFVT